MTTAQASRFGDASLPASDVPVVAHTYAFGPFLLDTRRRMLTKGAEMRRVPEKLFQLLLLLVEADGRIVTRDDFLARVWADAEASDANLKQHIFLLRTILGEHAGDNAYILTVPREGYRLAVSVERKTALVMKQVCERCQQVLYPDGSAMICSYECTFCVDCTHALAARCPNCGGDLVQRPRRESATRANAP